MTWGRSITESRERREAEKARNLAVLCVPVAVPRGTYAGELGDAEPKTEPRRNPHLLAMAKDMPCHLAIPGVCLGHQSRTSVSCHSNSSRHGKGGARKADDHYTVWGCMACHRWLDQGPAPQAVKVRAFELAHEQQRVAWSQIAYDPHGTNLYPPKDRKAARWALDQCIADEQKQGVSA